MFPSGVPQFDMDNFPTINSNVNYFGVDFDFDGFDYLDPSKVAGPSRTYTGAYVLGDLNSYPDYFTPSAAPAPYDPTYGLYPNEGYPSSFNQGVTAPSLPQTTVLSHQISSYSSLVPSPFAPALPHSSQPRSPNLHTVPAIPTPHEHPQPQAITTGGLDFDFFGMAESYPPPVANPTLAYDPTWEQFWAQSPPLDPPSFGLPPPDSVAVASATPPKDPLPVATASGSSAERTKQWVRETRRYNPLRAAGKKAKSDPSGWDQTLVRFRGHLDTLYNVQNGQPSGGLIPETALARIAQFAKEDLKRSPLRNTKAGEGKRCRNVEAYLEGLLEAVCQTDPAPPPAQEGSRKVASLSRLADELEARLAAINTQPALRRMTHLFEAGEKPDQPEDKVRRREWEKARRINGRYHIERISLLFKSEKSWSKKDLLGLAILFLLYGPTAFPQGFVQVRDPPVVGL